MTNKTLKELNVNPGDVVELTKDFFGDGDEGEMYLCREDGELQNIHDGRLRGNNFITGADSDFSHEFRIISRASDTPKLWRDMTPEEKGALLLAHHEGKAIEFYDISRNQWQIKSLPVWRDFLAYRIRPKSKVETVTCYWNGFSIHRGGNRDRTHRITFNLIDGKPDCDSVKMEEL